MNFFGHSVVAGWRAGHPRCVLGSMLPDFEAMLRTRLVAGQDPTVDDGIRLHHQTDDVFHRAPSFVQLCSETFGELVGRDVRRGTARAIAHVGTELFLDGYLARERQNENGYLAALSADAVALLRWQDGGHAFEVLRQKLARSGAPRAYDDPSFVLQRLTDTLRRRPRLALLDSHRDQVAAFLPLLRDEVERKAPELLQEVRNALPSPP